jgi:cold-inducible RNA-binding protein
MTKLYVGNLPYTVNSDELRSMFSEYGNVLSAVIIMDKISGRSKGFGFVELEDDNAAQSAISDMNEKDYQGRNLVVNVARPIEDRPRRDFNDQGRGGFGGRDNRGGNGGGRDFRRDNRR